MTPEKLVPSRRALLRLAAVAPVAAALPLPAPAPTVPTMPVCYLVRQFIAVGSGGVCHPTADSELFRWEDGRWVKQPRPSRLVDEDRLKVTFTVTLG